MQYVQFVEKKKIQQHVLDCEVELEKGKHTIGSSNINHQKQILKIFRENRIKEKDICKQYQEEKIVTVTPRNIRYKKINDV